MSTQVRRETKNSNASRANCVYSGPCGKQKWNNRDCGDVGRQAWLRHSVIL